MITKERLQEIEDMLNATTEGEWVAEDIPFDNSYDPCISTKDGTYIAQTTYDTLSNTCEHNIDADTLFIAASKTIVAELLTEIKRLKEKYGEGCEQFKITW